MSNYSLWYKVFAHGQEYTKMSRYVVAYTAIRDTLYYLGSSYTFDPPL